MLADQSPIAEIVAQLPTAFHPSIHKRCQVYAEQATAEQRDALLALPSTSLDNLIKIWGLSDFVGEYTSNRPELMLEMLASGDLVSVYTEREYRQRLQARIDDCTEESQLMAKLRQFRNREMCRIIWRDMLRQADLNETISSMTALADTSIDLALEWLYQDSCAKWGTPMQKQSDGERVPQRMVVIGMGKLGAHELNVSSDVDLIFAYPHNGETVGSGRTMENQAFFIRLGQRLISVIDKVTADGYVFRVDMRLRPYGQSGALALSFAAMEEYYQDQGRDWERYAMIKARVVAGDYQSGAMLLHELIPFVYRRYIDFSAFESLRDMKRMIVREVQRKGLEDNIKLGSGGIREIEFIAQAFQLIRGGRDKQLQQRELQRILVALGEEELLPVAAVHDLQDAYVFLRNLEHAIQGIADQQTQRLPGGALNKARVAFSMGFSQWQDLLSRLQIRRDKVAQHFADVVSFEEEQTNEAMAIDEDDVILWSMRLSEESALALLLEKGFDQPERTLKNIVDLRTSRSVQVMQSQGRQRLDRFMPLLISKVAAADASSETFSRVLRLVESVVRRTAYLVLLYENPGALEQLVFLCSASPWFAEQMARTPLLLDELLNSHSLYSPPEKAELDSELQQQLLRVPVEDLEEQMEVLRHFQKAHVLRVAASELNGTLPLMKVSDYLTFIAESMLAQVLDMAWASMTAKYGYPQREPGVACGKDFVIIGYGKVGGIELGYGSDLDLVFIHDAPSNLYTDGDKSIDNVVFFTRLGQRIIHILNTQTPSGMLYEVDMRLRPSGNSGLLVSSIGAFRQYQEQDAWTWEHQALVRARPLAGSDRVAEQFMAVREAILGQSRERLKLKQDVCEMREKMRVSLGTDAAEQHETFHIKHDIGGIVDLEFLVQYLVLAWSERFPALYRWTDNIRVLEEVGECGLLPKEKTDQLIQAYIALRSMMHKLSLQQQVNTVSAQLFPQERNLISDTWSEVMLSASDLI